MSILNGCWSIKALLLSILSIKIKKIGIFHKFLVFSTCDIFQCMEQILGVIGEISYIFYPYDSDILDCVGFLLRGEILQEGFYYGMGN